MPSDSYQYDWVWATPRTWTEMPCGAVTKWYPGVRTGVAHWNVVPAMARHDSPVAPPSRATAAPVGILSWDLQSAGGPIAPGRYSLRVTATDLSGKPPLVHRRCEDCEHVFSRPLHDFVEDLNRTARAL